jgi:enoyl-CoA hydratase/carnithine racemase
MITSQVSRDVLTLTLNSPRNRHALSHELVSTLTRALRQESHSRSARLVVLTATGTTFCSGADLATPPGADYPRAMQSLVEEILHLPAPVIARVNGHVRGGGVALVAACDIALAVPEATFAFNEVRLGVVAAYNAVLSRRVLHARPLQELMLTGRVFAAAEAVRVGLLTGQTDSGSMDSTIERIADDLHECDPTAVAQTKSRLLELGDLSRAAGYELVADRCASQFLDAPRAQAAIARHQPGATHPREGADPSARH